MPNSPTDPDDTSIAHALASGDIEAFAVLYDRLGGRLHAAARRMTGSSDAADEAVQDLFVALATARQTLLGVSDLEGYLFTMLRHAVSRRWREAATERRVMERVRRSIEERHGPEGLRASPPHLPDDRLVDAVASLPPPQREVVAMRVEEGLTFAEIAAVVGASPNTVMSRFRYALARLRTALGAVWTQDQKGMPR